MNVVKATDNKMNNVNILKRTQRLLITSIIHRLEADNILMATSWTENKWAIVRQQVRLVGKDMDEYTKRSFWAHFHCGLDIR